jgi:hypothetical protein
MPRVKAWDIWVILHSNRDASWIQNWLEELRASFRRMRDALKIAAKIGILSPMLQCTIA